MRRQDVVDSYRCGGKEANCQAHTDRKKILAEIEKDMLAQNLHCKFRTLSPTGNEAQPWRNGTETRQEGREGKRGTREPG